MYVGICLLMGGKSGIRTLGLIGECRRNDSLRSISIGKLGHFQGQRLYV